MTKSFNEWVDEYEEKTGEEFTLPPGFSLYFLPERGFAQYRLVNGLVIVYQLCGDILYWFDVGKMIAHMNGAKAVATVCILPIKAYIRLLRCHIVKDEEKDGKHRYVCKDSIGHKLICTYRSTEEGTDTYFCTYYLDGGRHG